MFNKSSIYALNKKDADAIVYPSVTGELIRVTRDDFASEEEFIAFKKWSDDDFHTEDNRDVVEGKHTVSMDSISEAALVVPAVDVEMERRLAREEQRRQAAEAVSQIKGKITDTQFRRLWMYKVDDKTIDEIGEIEGISHQNVSKSITSALKKIKK